MRSLPVLFDPALLAIVPTITAEQFRMRITFLVHWAQTVGKSDANIHMAPDTREFLDRNGLFPAHSSVEETLKALNLRYRYAPQDIIGPINSILNGASMQFYCCAKDEYHDSFNSIPAPPWHDNPDLDQQTQRTLLMGRIEQILHGSPETLVLASIISGDPLQFSASVVLVDPDDLPGLASGSLPQEIIGSVKVASNLEGVLDCISAKYLWETATNNADLKLAIQVRCREKLKGLNAYTSMSEIPGFYVGADFYASIVRNQASGEGKFASLTLDGCASALLEEANFEWNDFDKPKRKEDNAIPLRAHLSKANTAIRLMAWHRPIAPSGRCLEFSNIGPKWEEQISDTNPTEAV